MNDARTPPNDPINPDPVLLELDAGRLLQMGAFLMSKAISPFSRAILQSLDTVTSPIEKISTAQFQNLHKHLNDAATEVHPFELIAALTIICAVGEQHSKRVAHNIQTHNLTSDKLRAAREKNATELADAICVKYLPELPNEIAAEVALRTFKLAKQFAERSSK